MRGASEYHGAGGPLRVAEQRSPRPLNRRLLAASEAAGIPRIADYNGPEQDGASMFQVTQKNGRRFSAADAYLRPALARPNLEVRTGVTALGVELEGERAVGVRLRKGRRGEELVRAEREVLLAAGAIGSPQLLLLSGIGAGEELRAAGVQARHELPGVGRNLQDHPFVTVDLGGLGRQTRCTAPTSPSRSPSGCCADRASSPRRSPRSCAFTRTRGGLPAADIQFHMGAAYFEDHGAEEYDGHCMVIAPVLVSPKARGQVWLRSADPTAKPRIITNSLSEPEDLESMLAGMALAREIAAQYAAARDRRQGAQAGPGDGRSRASSRPTCAGA